MLRKFLSILVISLLLTMSASAHAAITQLRSSPSVKIIPVDRSVTFTIVWSVRTDGGITKTLETDDGEFLLGGVAVQNIAALPTQTKTVGAPISFFSFTFTETITVSRALIDQSIKQNQPLTFRRTFTDDNFGTTVNGVLPLQVSSGIGGPLEVSRMRLAFENNATICNASAGDDITVKSFVETEGSGILRGSWQVRQNAVDSAFRTIKTIQTPVNGGRDVELTSPPLPAGTSGRIDVRLKIDTPELQFTEPFVTCIISGSDPHVYKKPLAGKTVQVIHPKPFMPIQADTVIEWKELQGAKAYLIEILADRDGEPVAAQEVNPDRASAKLTPVTLDKLDPKRRYMVRVLAK